MTPHRISRVCHRLRGTASGAADGGFTILEVLVSFVVFMIVMTSASVGIVNALQASHLSQQRVDAANIAQEYVARAIAAASTVAPQAGLTSSPHVGNGGTGSGSAANEYFTVLQWITFDSGNTCHPGTLFTVNVEVHQQQTNQFLARSDARVACPPA
jgi:Tfp pilus assembly protein PilV